MARKKLQAWIDEKEFEQLHELAENGYEGNLSLALRYALRGYFKSLEAGKTGSGLMAFNLIEATKNRRIQDAVSSARFLKDAEVSPLETYRILKEAGYKGEELSAVMEYLKLSGHQIAENSISGDK